MLSQDIDNCILEDSQQSKKQSQHSQLSSTDSQQNNSQSLFNSQQSCSQQSTAKSPIPVSQVLPSQEISKIPIPKILNQSQHQDTPPIAKRATVRIGLNKVHLVIFRVVHAFILNSRIFKNLGK